MVVRGSVEPAGLDGVATLEEGDSVRVRGRATFTLRGRDACEVLVWTFSR